MYIRRKERRELILLSTFLCTNQRKWPIGISLTVSTNVLFTKIYATFRDSLDYEGLLEKAEEISELNKHVFDLITHAILRKSLLEQLEDDREAKHDFETLNKQICAADAESTKCRTFSGTSEKAHFFRRLIMRLSERGISSSVYLKLTFSEPWVLKQKKSCRSILRSN